MELFVVLNQKILLVRFKATGFLRKIVEENQL